MRAPFWILLHNERFSLVGLGEIACLQGAFLFLSLDSFGHQAF